MPLPFDTTYFIISNDDYSQVSYTVPGGKDTAIYVAPGQLPSEIDSLFASADSVVRQLYQTGLKNENQPEPYTPDTGFTIFFLAVFSFIIYLAWKKSEVVETYSRHIFPNRPKQKLRSYHRYYGNELGFSGQQLTAILTKRFPYYNHLAQNEKLVFVERLQKFIANKIFKIHGEKGYKEMPVLVSAAAIQLTFGLKKYLLPHFKFINIHPQEFLRVRPILCFLEGNVSGHSINLSWKHFLEGYGNPNDGQNVGLHEMAHALYYQTFEVEKNIDKGFRNFYNHFHMDGNKAFHTEKTVAGGLYSEYAEKNFQEFWAESVEIFFEKPVDMYSYYPQLYETMKQLLRQDTLNSNPTFIS